MDYSERMISSMPVIVRRRVRFGECDPAGVVYTPVFSEYVISAYEWLMSVLMGGPRLQEMRRLSIDSPMKALTLEFRNMLEPEQVFDMTCRIAAIRSRTFDIEIIGRSTTNDPYDIFVARLTPIIVARSERRSIEIPAALRTGLQDYQTRSEAIFSATGSVQVRAG